MLHQIPKIAEAAAFIQKRWPHTPHAGIILGTGLGNLASAIESPTNIPYEEIPHFPRLDRDRPQAGNSFAARWPGCRSSPCKAAFTFTKAIRSGKSRCRCG